MSKELTQKQVYKLSPEAAAKKKEKAALKNKPRNKGIPVEPGMNFADLPKEVRDAYFFWHENYWKQQYNRSKSTISGNFDFGKAY